MKEQCDLCYKQFALCELTEIYIDTGDKAGYITVCQTCFKEHKEDNRAKGGR